MPATPVVNADLTAATLDGTGVFDLLMRAAKAHLEAEFTKGRIKGPEYATVYLGSMEAVLQASVSFLLQRDKTNAEICKLQAEFDLLLETKAKTTEEKILLQWKTATEKAQTLSTGVDADSVIGKQKALYQAQKDGFTRDAEQKATKLMVDTWSVRRTTDEGTVADATNLLNDATIGRAVNKMLTGIGA